MDELRKSVREIRRGNVVATIWTNRMKGRNPWYTVTVTRRYQRNRAWHTTTTLRFDDLINARKVVGWAHFWIWWYGRGSARKYW
jgi:hypothetical protein